MKKKEEKAQSEWEMSWAEAAKLEHILKRKQGIRLMLDLMNELSAQLIEDEAAWWKGVEVSCGLPGALHGSGRLQACAETRVIKLKPEPA
jgi:hypothetical protein